MYPGVTILRGAPSLDARVRLGPRLWVAPDYAIWRQLMTTHLIGYKLSRRMMIIRILRTEYVHTEAGRTTDREKENDNKPHG